MRLIVNADDFGLTRGITDTILEAIEGGSLSGVSIVPNGNAFDYARSAIGRSSRVRVAAHLNLVEGEPAAAPQLVASLLKSGRLENSFQSLWRRHRRAAAQDRRKLEDEVRAELTAQLERFAGGFGPGALTVDSHQHVHMVPFVFDILVELAGKYNVGAVRIPREPVIVPHSPTELAITLSSNAVKHVLLNRLSARAIPRLKEAGISCCDRFIGVQFTGRMSESVVRRALRRVAATVGNQASVEILFHPGEASPNERSTWSERRDLADYYFSPERAREREVLKSASFRGLVAEYAAA